MNNKNKTIGDTFFFLQIAGALVLCTSQFLRMLQTVQGVSLTMFLLIEAFLLLHLALAYSAHCTHPSRITAQTLYSFAVWVFLIGTNIAAVLMNGTYQWSSNDTTTVRLAVLGTVAVVFMGKMQGWGIHEPPLRAFLAIFYKAAPQLFLAWKIIQEGGAGIPGLAIVTGHVTILLRVAQIWLGIREAGWERNRRWLFVSETVNEASWVVVSIAWLCWDL